MIKVDDYSIFDGIIGDENRKTLLDCIHAKEESFQKGDSIDPKGFKARTALVLDGGCAVADQDGLKTYFEKGDLIGVNYFDISKSERIDAMSDFSLLFMDNEGFEAPCWFSCFFHAKFIDNMEKAKEK